MVLILGSSLPRPELYIAWWSAKCSFWPLFQHFKTISALNQHDHVMPKFPFPHDEMGWWWSTDSIWRIPGYGRTLPLNKRHGQRGHVEKYLPTSWPRRHDQIESLWAHRTWQKRLNKGLWQIRRLCTVLQHYPKLYWRTILHMKPRENETR